MDHKNSSDKRFALLIDADNVSARYIKPILDELSKYGTVTVKRIYGDWTLSLHAKWKEALLENSITPIQQFGYTQGKNATDSAMIIDAMDLLYEDALDGFCIVSSDSDFTRLASRLRESGLTVIGMGEKKTPTPFRRACDVFTTLEVIGGGNKGNGATMSKQDVEDAVVDIITENLNNGKATGLGEVGSRMLKRYPDFDVRSYGTNLLSKLLEEFDRIKIIKDHSNVTVELVEGASDSEKESKRSGRRRRSRKVSARHDQDTGEQTEIAEASKPDTEGSSLEGTSEAKEAEEAKAAEAPEAVEASAAPADRSTSDGKGAKEPKPKRSRTRGGKKEKAAPANEPQDNVTDVKRYIHELVKASGSEGISLSHLGNEVRDRFKDFKVRDLGFSQMRQYVASVGDFEVVKSGRSITVKMAE